MLPQLTHTLHDITYCEQQLKPALGTRNVPAITSNVCSRYVFIWLPTYRTVWTNTSVVESYLSWNHAASMRFIWYTTSWTFSWPHWTTIQEGLPDMHTAWSKHAPNCWWSSTSPKGTNLTGVVTCIYNIISTLLAEEQDWCGRYNMHMYFCCISLKVITHDVASNLEPSQDACI